MELNLLSEIAQSSGEFVKSVIHVDSLPPIVINTGISWEVLVSSLIALVAIIYSSWNVRQTIKSQENIANKNIKAELNSKTQLRKLDEFIEQVSIFLNGYSDLVKYNYDVNFNKYNQLKSKCLKKDDILIIKEQEKDFANYLNSLNIIRVATCKIELMWTHNEFYSSLLIELEAHKDFSESISDIEFPVFINNPDELVEFNDGSSMSFYDYLEDSNNKFLKLNNDYEDQLKKLYELRKNMLECCKKIITSVENNIYK